MLRNITGAHIQTITDYSKPLLTQGRAGCVKICHPAFDIDLVMAFHNNNPDSPIDLRLIADDANLDNALDKTRQAIKLFAPLRARLPDGIAWLENPINEKYVAGDELRRLGDVTVRCAQLCIEAGFLPVGFNFPVGNPARIAGATIDGITYTTANSELRLIYDAVAELNKLGGAVGYHNYTVPTNQLDDWLDLRHLRMAKELPPSTRWWLSEGMYDYGIIGNVLRGWRYEPFHQGADDVARYLRRLAQRVSADLSVIGDTPFGAGPTPDWSSFQYDNEPGIVAVFAEKYPVADTPVIGQGLRRMIPYLGQPLESEVYHFPGTPMEMSAAVFENGVAQWYRASNETVGQRSDGVIYTDKGNNGDGNVYQVWPAP